MSSQNVMSCDVADHLISSIFLNYLFMFEHVEAINISREDEQLAGLNPVSVAQSDQYGCTRIILSSCYDKVAEYVSCDKNLVTFKVVIK